MTIARHRTRPAAPGLLALVALAFSCAAPLRAEDPPAAGPAPAPAAPPAVYKNGLLGLSVTGPKGWKLTTSGSESATWTRLAVFDEPGTQVQVAVSQRRRTATSLDALEQQVRKEWTADKAFSLTGVNRVDATAIRPIAYVQVEANQIRKPAAAAPGAPAGQPTAWQLLVTYVLAPGSEILVYGHGPAVAWSKARPLVQALVDSITLSAPPRGPEGEGAYRNDARGFSLRFPKGYTVVVPQRQDHVASFVPVSGDQPTLDVYLLPWKEDVARDAERLVKHYQETRGGQASSKVYEVAGQPGMLVTAQVTEQGRESVVLLALVKRGEELFRVRASIPKASEQAGQAVFDDLIRSFAMTSGR